jgi:hypothetical protein
VTINDGIAAFPDIPRGGGTGENLGDVFRLAADFVAPQGFEFTLTLTVSAQNYYQKDFDIGLFVGLPEWRTHDVGAVQLTVTDQGILGYMDTDRVEGMGFGPRGDQSGLYIGSLWAGNHRDYVCNNDFGASGPDPADWLVLTTPNGRVRDLGSLQSDQTFEGIFSDAGHPTPKSIVVRQRSFAWADPPFNDFVLVSYTIRNQGSLPLTNYHLGLFCDFDLGGGKGYAHDEGAHDPIRRMAYLYNENQYCGVSLLGNAPVKNMTLIHNPTYIDPNGFMADVFKFHFLQGIISNPASTTADDWSALTSAGPFDLAPGDSLRVSFALAYGTSLTELQTAADRASEVLTMTPVVGNPPEPWVVLEQNRPNPFNPRTTIQFSLMRKGHVELAIFDLSGRKVTTLVTQDLGSGDYTVTWDGTDQRGNVLPSGLYLYRLHTDHNILARKMILLR